MSPRGVVGGVAPAWSHVSQAPDGPHGAPGREAPLCSLWPEPLQAGASGVTPRGGDQSSLKLKPA